MIFKPRIWYPIAVVLSIVNWAGAGWAAALGETWHATAHVALALAFGYWGKHLRERIPRTETPTPASIEGLEGEMSRLRDELTETQERLDFAERMLAQRPDPGRVAPQR